MPRVSIYQGGQVESQGITRARHRAADFGPSPLAEGLQQIGKVGAEAVERLDQIEDVKARVEANRLAVEHSEHVREIGRRVSQTLGEDAESAADNGVQELEKATKDVIGRASPRARMLLESELRTRSGAATDSWLEHGFKQKADALETSSQARIGRIVEDAADLDDENAALAMLSEVQGINQKRADFFGKGKDWLIEEDRKVVSGFYRSRALKLAAGQAGSASAAIGYAEKNREFLSDDDYNAIINAYDDAAMDEAAMALVYGGSPPGAAVQAEPPEQVPEGEAPKARLDPISFFKAFTVPAEGRTYVIDSNGRGAKFGINEEYNPGVNVKGLTEAGAAKIFTERYYKRSGADKLPPALAAVHVDTFYLNERQATKILKQSGGDVDKYIELRGAFLNSLAAKNPAKFARYQKGWANRTKALAAYADRLGGDGTPLAVPIAPDTSLEAIRAAVTSRSDISWKLKRKLISTLESRRSEIREERSIAEQENARQITTHVLSLGDNFTDIKQIPPELLTAASPSTIAQFTAAANSNKTAKQNQPMSPEVAAQVGFLKTFKPDAFADPKVQQQLLKQGVPVAKVRELAESAGQAMGKVADVDRGRLEQIARPAFEAAGIRLWTTENKPGKFRDQEQGQEAAQRANLLSYLDLAARTWAAANPGKEPDEATMKKWVGSAMVTVQNGQAFGTVSNTDLVRMISPSDRRAIVDELNSNNIAPTESNVAEAYRKLRLLRGR